MKTVAIVAAKGGVGKSSVAANLSVAFRQAGQPVLALDLDPQNALRFHLGADHAGINGIARASVAAGGWRDVSVQGASHVHLLPFGLVNETDRQVLERQMSDDPSWLASRLASLELDEDTWIVIDTPPGPSAYLRQALGIADLVIVVTLADAASYATLPMIEGLIAHYCADRPGFLGHAYIINQVDRTRPLAKDSAQVIRDALGNRVLGVVHLDQSVSEALAHGKTVIEYDRHSQGRTDLVACAHWVLRQLRISEAARQ